MNSLQDLTRTAVTGALALVCSGAMMLAAAGPVQAQTVERVAHADLNLATAAGRATLNARVEAAARRVCARMVDRTDLVAMARISHCRAAARQSAAAQLAALTTPTMTAAVE